MASLCARPCTASRPPRPKSAYSHLCSNQVMDRVSLLEDCLAVQLQRVGPSGAGPPHPHAASHYWMYDTGYLLFQGFLEANSKCFWDGSLVAAVRGLEYRGYVSPGVLFVSGGQCALEVVRSAWTRNLLRPPPNYTISLLGEVEGGCRVVAVRQAGFTPLPDAVCWAVLELGAAGTTANLETIRATLAATFPAMQLPSSQIIYDTLADLTAYNKVYQTCQGYFVATPDSVRLEGGGGGANRSLLMSTSEAVTLLHGEMATIREGARTHQAVQTNLADVICGGNKSDKVLWGRSSPAKSGGGRLERRHSMKMGGSSRRLASLQRTGSVRLLPHDTLKKSSLLSKLFRWAKKPAPPIASPSQASENPRHPHEWFNSTVLHLHSVATQTSISEEIPEWREGSVRTRRRSLSTSRLPRRAVGSPAVSSPTVGSPAVGSPASRPSTPSSCKTPIYSSTPKALSCASSGYNSLPRSMKGGARREAAREAKLPGLTTTVDEAGVVTTTITGPDQTRIYLEHSGSPVRSVITVQNGSPRRARRRSTDRKPESKRPLSMYTEDPVLPLPLPLDKIKFPSTETIQLEEKLILSESKTEKNLLSDKAGSMVDVSAKAELNNCRRPSASMNPIPDKLYSSLSFKNLLKDSQLDLLKKDLNLKLNISESPVQEKHKEMSAFPSLNDVSLHFTSITAQNILKGVGINSIENLVDLNLGTDKNVSNVSYHTDLGIV